LSIIVEDTHCGVVNLVRPSVAGMIGGLISVGRDWVVPSYKGFRFPVFSMISGD
jgi:hypothetical protein